MPMRFPGFLPLIAPILLLAGCGASPAEQLAAAQQQFAAEDFVAARSALTELLHDDPANKAALIMLAAAQLELGDAQGARATIGRARAAGASAQALLYLSAAVDLAAGQPQAALDLLGAANTAESWRIRAEAQLALGKPDKALIAFRTGLAQGEEPRLLDSCARFLLAGEDLTGAQALLQKLQTRAPQRYRTLMLTGALAEAQGRWADAEKAYAAAAERYPTRTTPLVARAAVLDTQNRLPEATSVIEQAAQIAPDDPEVVMGGLRVMADRAQWRQVRDALQRNEDALDPQGPDAMLYGEALYQLGFVEQARALLGRTVLLQPGNVYARRLLAQAQLAGGDAEAAAATLTPLADNLNATADDLALLAKAADATGDPAAAVWAARAASPEFRRRAPLLTAGQLALQVHDWPKAVAAFADLAAQGPALGAEGQGYVLARLAYAQARGGHGADALGTASRVLALAPADPQALKAAALARMGLRTDLATAGQHLRQVLAAQPQDYEAVILLDRLAQLGG